MIKGAGLQFGEMTLKLVAALTIVILSTSTQATTIVRGWTGYGGNAQHTGRSSVTAQALRRILWSTPVDLDRQYSGEDLLIHYGTPLLTPGNTVVVTVKTGAQDGFRLEGRRGQDGSLLWTLPTDYTLPPHGWTPSCGSALTTQNALIAPAAGGTVLRRDNTDGVNGVVSRQAFYGIENYDANPNAFNVDVKICTPITPDGKGNVYFGFIASNNPLNLKSGIARVSADGQGRWISASDAAQDQGVRKVVYNCAPALSGDGKILYVAVNGSVGYLLALNSTSLAPFYRVRPTDPVSGAQAGLPDDGTASPTIGPDGDVYFGVLETPFGSHHLRGWLMHYSKDLSQSKLPGSFGWDDTVSIVPRGAVPSYRGNSSYLILTKYNDYLEGGGGGMNRVAILDPNAPMLDRLSAAAVMNEVMTHLAPTPDDRGGVREWCINTAAVDPSSRSALVNNEDGIVYRWNLATNQFSQRMVLTDGLGEAYTPTVIGPNGTNYAISNGILFAIGEGTRSILDAISISTYQGSLRSGSVADVHTPDGATYNVASAAIPGMGQVATVIARFNVGRSGQGITLLSPFLDAVASHRVTGFVWLFNWTTGRYDFVQSFDIGTASAGPTQITSPPNTSPYVSSSGDIDVAFRALDPGPAHNGRLAVPFVFKVDLLSTMVSFDG